MEDTAQPPDLPEKGAGVLLEPSADNLRGAIKESLLQMAEELVVRAGYAAGFKSDVYSALIAHVRQKFLAGTSLGLAEPVDLAVAWKMLPQMRDKVSAVPGLIAGIIEYGN